MVVLRLSNSKDYHNLADQKSFHALVEQVIYLIVHFSTLPMDGSSDAFPAIMLDKIHIEILWLSREHVPKFVRKYSLALQSHKSDRLIEDNPNRLILT